MTTIRLIEPVFGTYKARKALRHDYQLAKRLGLEATALSNYKSGARRLPDKAIAELAAGIDVPIGDVLAAVNLSLDQTTLDDRQFWLSTITNPQMRDLATQFRSGDVPAPERRHRTSFASLANKALKS